MFKVDDILVCSWGHEQTNVDFYQVVKASKKMVTVRQITKVIIPDSSMTGACYPQKNKFVTGTERIKRKVLYTNKPFIYIKTYQVASLYDDCLKRYSQYA